MRRATTRPRRLLSGESLAAIVIGVGSGVYIFDEPLRRWAAQQQPGPASARPSEQQPPPQHQQPAAAEPAAQK